MTFNPREHFMQLKSSKGPSDYLEVKWRLVWFRELCPEGTIDTEEVLVDLDRICEVEVSVWNNEKRKMEKVLKLGKGYARFRATVTDGKGGRATATGSECGADFGDFTEKAETKSVGRALAMLGYGTQFTGEELAEHHRIVDSPVSRQDEQQPDPATDIEEGISEQQMSSKGISEQQMSSIRKLCLAMNKPEPDLLNALSFQGARKKLQQLTDEYKEYLFQQRRVKQAQPASPVAAPDIETAAPTPIAVLSIREIYAKGKEKGLWANSAGFTEFLSAQFARPIEPDTKFTVDQRLELSALIEKAEQGEEMPVPIAS